MAGLATASAGGQRNCGDMASLKAATPQAVLAPTVAAMQCEDAIVWDADSSQAIGREAMSVERSVW